MEKLIKGVIIIILAIIVGNMLFSLGGCKPVEKYKSSPQYPADCASDFPIREVTEYIKGETKTDTIDHWIEVDCNDTIEIRTVDIEYVPRIVKTKCPPSTNAFRVDTAKITQESTAKLEALQRTFDNYKDSAIAAAAIRHAEFLNAQSISDVWEGKAKKRFWWLIIVIAAVGGWTFRHSIIRLFTK